MAQSKIRRLKTGAALSTLIFSAALIVAPAAWADAKVFAFDIPAENAAKALNDFSVQAKVQLLFPYDVAARSVASAVKGDLTREAALAQLLLNTNLEVASQTDTTISLRVKESRETTTADPVTEVIVTGTHIRGGNPTSPVHLIARKDIQQSGYSQVGDLVRSLPENFAGGQNPGVIGAGLTNSTNANASNASTVNLRGLGTDATLVLLNGHRLSADSFFQGADISGIPLAAIQRMEIVPDGASALYGSDAVAGVVNFILRRDFDGAEVSARVGAATQGGGTERTYSALGGLTRGDWYILGNYEYSKQDGITAGERDFTADASPVTTLWQPQTRNSLFVSGGKDFTDKVSLTFDTLVSERDTRTVTQAVKSSYIGYNAIYTPAYSAAATLKIVLPHDLNLRLVAGGSGSRNKNEIEIPAYAYAYQTRYRNDGQYVETILDGSLAHTPAGDVKFAAGLGYRREGFQQGASMDVDRNVSSLFAEALVPLIAPSANRAGLHEFEISVAGRAENYSDIGSSTNPKIGIRYVPFTDLTLRGSWGTSFKAPSFSQLYGSADLYLYPASAVGYNGPSADATAMLAYGGNKDLKPERSTSWTLGAEYMPREIPSLKLSVTYFDIDYKDRVVQPVSYLVAALTDPIYAPFIDTLPSASAQAAAITASDSFSNYSGVPYDPAGVLAIIHDNFQNATAQTAKGFDVSYRQSFDLGGGTLSAFANATTLTLKQQTIPTLPVVELSGTIFNAPDFKARAGMSWSEKRLIVTAIANYVGSETDTVVSPPQEVGSWTTVDANVSYRFGDQHPFTVTLAASNLFDRDPPRALSPSISYEGVYFDSTRSSIVGRFVSVTLSKSW
ncbi:TonB-dependent receptor [Asticcacaulis benevestitus]|uniref:Secretin/TonB short N-terminal domain-containing protein n=1 Tax=Asticcacaulis benevestitus DSM 16100 = ATCC BAA-896 TaxID=1121022 RepID=V4PYV5_9CAUL|nr:TonB-dependent receptor [Asticcacaulis benevestitus]ESQ92584.1 hypothetical protein ABENE_08070 [Asticcacaulis benevestitus DSM 16100 = ATCC BAA-896]